MTIAEAIEEVSKEYSAECVLARLSFLLNKQMTEILREENSELDERLPSFVADMAGKSGAPEGYLPEYVYMVARMCFRLGMRTQRKIDRPDETTTMFWRKKKRETS